MTAKQQIDLLHNVLAGVVSPSYLYESHAVHIATGMDEEKLKVLRTDGRLKAYRFNGCDWYRGEDLIAIILAGEGGRIRKHSADG